MILATLLATAVEMNGAFLNDFGGTWTCTNGTYHVRWDIHPLAGHPSIAEVVYGDPAKPAGFAFVYFVPGAEQFRYDDFHADGAQAHLTSSPPTNGAWEWSGVYYPIGNNPDTSGDIIWQRTATRIERHFRQRVNGTPVERASDVCTKVST